MSKYRKLIVALIGATVTSLTFVYGADTAVVVIFEAYATAFGVWLIPNDPV